ncbi:16269_t:CDS:1, partial [Cetraspora pellucida]
QQIQNKEIEEIFTIFDTRISYRAKQHLDIEIILSSIFTKA